MSEQPAAFGEFRLDAEERLLYRGAAVVPLTPKAWELLHALAKHIGRVVDHDRLMRQVWPDTVVEEGNLAKLVFHLRQALGPMPDGAPWIETLPRRGYRLNEAPVAPAPPSAVEASGALTIAVLAFVDMSPGGDQAALCEGISEEILQRLSRLPDLRVVSRTSSFHFSDGHADARQVGSLLGAQALIEGSVRRHGDELRITARLVDTADGTALWSETFARAVGDVFAMQDEIADAAARCLERRVRGESMAQSPRRDLLAWEAYLQGRYLWNRRWTEPVERLLASFEKAVELDPAFAEAWAGMADVYSTLGSWEAGSLPHDQAQLQARALAQRALELDPELAEAHSTLAYVALHYDRDVPDADRRFRKALSCNPHYSAARHWHSHALVATGRFSEALTESRAALALDPMNLLLHAHFGWHHFMARQPDEGRESSRRVIAMEPAFQWGHFFLGMAEIIGGDAARAVDAFREAARHGGDSPVMLGGLAHAQAMAGDRRAARATLRRIEDADPPNQRFAYERALVHAALGDSDRAFECLDAASRHRSGWLAYAAVEPRLDPLRADPRFTVVTSRSS
jgi:TolB-like protein/Tfp pilus assembly protein PilF